MKKALRAISLFLLAGALMFVGCDDPVSPAGSGGGREDNPSRPSNATNTYTVTANGSATVDTTSLTFEFRNDVTELSASNISVTGDATAGTPLEGSGKIWTLPITVTKGGLITVKITKTGIETNTKTVGVWKDGITTITYNVIANGSGATETTTALNFTFSLDTTIAIGDITITNGSASVTPGSLSGGSKTWSLAISGVSSNGTIKVKITKDGFDPAEKTVAVYKEKLTVSADGFAKPIITSIFTADPSAHVWPTDPNRLYLYPSQDVWPAAGCNLMDRYHVFSTDNMVDWIDHGEILKRDDLPVDTWGPHYTDAYFMWAPDAAYRTGVKDKSDNSIGPYFFYFPHSTGADGGGAGGWGANWEIGVVWSDKPYADFDGSKAVKLTRPDGSALKTSEGIGDNTGKFIDPCIFEDEGVYYLVTGGSQEFRIAKLKDNMVELAEEFRVFTQTDLPYYHEGPWMFTRRNNNGTKVYYLMYPGQNIKIGDAQSDQLLYATSTAGPYGPWTFQGPILDPVNTGDTSHGSITEFKGKWYLFYHNAVLSQGQGTLRSVCVDELFFSPSGTIQKVIQTSTSTDQNGPNFDKSALDTKFGSGKWTLETKYTPPGEEDYSAYGKEGGTYEVTVDGLGVTQSTYFTFGGGAQREGAHIGHMNNTGAWAQFAQIDGGEGGLALLVLEHAKGNTGSELLKIEVGGRVYRLSCPPTSGWGAPYAKTASCLINLTAGTANTVRFSGAGINIKSFTIYFEGEDEGDDDDDEEDDEEIEP